MDKWEILDSEEVLTTKWLVVEKHKCKISDNKIVDDFYVVKKKDFVVLVVEDHNHIYLLNQYRHGILDYVTNLPMGIIDDNESPEETAKRELLEETGHRADNLEHLGIFYHAPSYMSTKVHVFYIKDPVLVASTKIDENEGELILIKISKEELKKKIMNNEIKDITTIMALHIARERLNLF